ncbi:MAG: DUF6390 family protein [Chloroflexi bacterium]|nr:DUF6390 family protein [Chloroflexota bacterium]
MQSAPSPTREPRRPAPSGPVLFARYAYGPNRLGLCGPDDADSLFGESTTSGDDREVRHLARGFEGAYPYLELIARANAIADPLDAQVVEAYWLGSPLLDRVTPNLLGGSLRLRFRPRLAQSAWKWLESSAPAGAKPVHAFHVLDVFPKVGLMRSEHVDDVLRTMDSCRIRWGRVLERDGDQLLVNAVPLSITDGELTFGPSRPERISAWRDGRGFINEVVTGDIVSIHWDWACDVLDADQVARLIAWTQRQLEVANKTF